MKRRHKAEVVVQSSATEPTVTVTSTLPKPLAVTDMRLLVVASLLNEIEDTGQATGIPPAAHEWARLVTGAGR